MSQSILYISYDGILEPLGQSQVLAYQEKLADKYDLHLMSFEKPEDWENVNERQSIQERLMVAGIAWRPLRYHKSPSAFATTYDLLQGIVVGAWMIKRHDIQIVHARSYVPAVIALVLKKLFGVKFIFDMRGFWADERVDGGLWLKTGRLYRIAKWFERHFLLNADRVVSLTQAAIDEMRTFPYLQNRLPKFELITTCADLELFHLKGSESASSKGKRPFTLGYVGSVGVWYQFDEALRCFQILKEKLPDARLYILNRGGHDYIRERTAALKIDSTSVVIKSADHERVARAMRQMDAGIFFYKQAYSKKATAPTKLGEFLGCGVPCMGNTGVGDMARVLRQEQVGVALDGFDEIVMREGVDRLLALTQVSGIENHCREVAERFFSLEEGVQSTDRMYRELG